MMRLADDVRGDVPACTPAQPEFDHGRRLSALSLALEN